MIVFDLKMMVKSGLEKNAPFIRANLVFLGSRNSEGARGIPKYFFLDHFSPSFLSQKWSFKELRF